jgi:hypothetical protein
MVRRHKFGIALMACGLVVCLAWWAEKKSRPWRVPSYHVSLPVEFDIEDAEGHGKGRETFRYSPRAVYLESHRQGWEKAKREWIRGYGLGNLLAQVPGIVNQASNDGWQQFHRERW